ncbi:MAG: hypothetical protein ACI376_09520 [Candidatus Bruticola sp.]
MDEVFSSAALQNIKRRARQRLRRCARRGLNEQVALTEQDCRDAWARELFRARLDQNIRQRAFSQLVQVSPGGLLALAWLCSNASETITVDKIISYACELADPDTNMNLTREASLEPLDKDDSLYCCEAILSKAEVSKNDRVCLLICLLMSNCLSEEGRSAIVERSLDMRCFDNSNRRTICQWAMGLDVEKDISVGFLKPTQERPLLAPTFLARKAITCLVGTGEDASKVIRHIVKNFTCWPDTRAILHGMLDLMVSMEPQERLDLQNQGVNSLGIYELCINYGDAAVRRRAYALAAETEDYEFLRKALHDKDLGVRNWALSYVSKLN